MLHGNAVDLLTRHGLRRDGDVFHAQPQTIVSIYLSNGSQQLILDRISSIAITADVAMITTSRREVYGVEVAELRAIRVTPEASGPGYR
jgi:hypothetical protein